MQVPNDLQGVLLQMVIPLTLFFSWKHIGLLEKKYNYKQTLGAALVLGGIFTVHKYRILLRILLICLNFRPWDQL